MTTIQTPAVPKTVIPKAVLAVCEVLSAAGYQAWIVGGAVRDLMLGKTPSDWDVASDALPEAVLQLFDRTIATGLQHGTVTAVMGRGKDRESVEITSFRGEGAYSDARRPDSVHFGVPLDEDLKRRDFVINAMAYDPMTDTVYDPFGGNSDLQVKLVRAVGVATERFSEDGLRVLRAVRFVSTLDFALEKDTEAALSTALTALGQVAAERVRVEVLKLLGGQAPARALEIASRNGILAVILPELQTVDRDAAYRRVSMMATDPVLRLATLLLEVPAKSQEALLRRLTMSNEDRQRIVAAVRHFREFAAACAGAQQMRVHLSTVGRAAGFDHLDVVASEGARTGDAACLDGVALGRQILASGVPLEVRDLAIGGTRLMELTSKRGRIIGEVLRKLLAIVLEDPSCNQAEVLEEKAVELGLK